MAQALYIYSFEICQKKSTNELEHSTGIPRFTLLMWGHKKNAEAKTM